MEKKCIKCNSIIQKKQNENAVYFESKKYCSKNCYYKSKKGIIPTHVKLWQKGSNISPETQFKKGCVSLRKGIKQPQSEEQKLYRKSRLPSGDRHWNWKGGVTKINEKIRKSFEYKQWHKEVLKRDFYTCQICSYKGKDIEVDHIKAFYLYPELRFDVNNGRVLCKTCHRKTDTWGRKVYLLELVGQNI